MIEIPAKWPSNVCRCFPVAVSQILIVASAADGVSWWWTLGQLRV